MSTLPTISLTTNSYDETPYPAASHAQTHPNRMAAMGRLFGLAPANPFKARVLELGCADGSNLLPMAEGAPEGSFVGIDSSPVQIAAGTKAQAAIDVSNVELRCQDILDFNSQGEKFDYIIAHGIFSWVPEQVRAKILQICNECLAPDGIAYVSYNALPGWHMRRALRDMMIYHTRAQSDPRQKVLQARALLKFLTDSMPTEKNPFGLFLKHELELLTTLPDSYIRHDLLGEENAPFYFHEFVDQASRHGLQYLGETSLSAMVASHIPAAVQQVLSQVSNNIVAHEQYMDFLRNRIFRQTLLCRSAVQLKRDLTADLMQRFAIQPYFNPAPANVDFSATVSVPFGTNSGQQIGVTDPFLKGVFSVLAASNARAIAYDDLLGQARSVAHTDPMLPNRDQVEEATLRSNLMNLYTMGIIDLCAEPVNTSLTVPMKPVVAPLARYQAMNSRYITNRLHQAVPADALGRHLVAACDGEKTVPELIDIVMQAITNGQLQLSEGGAPVTDANRVRALVIQQVDGVLSLMARSGLFAPQ